MDLPDRDSTVPLLSVVLVGWNTRDDVLECLRLLSRQTYPRVQIVLVDNGSTDGTAAAVRAEFPSVLLLPLDRNHGFARAVNLAMRAALDEGAEYILLLNPDTSFEPDLLAGL